jgi:predicted MPP superfamily phosphohydrolase
MDDLSLDLLVLTDLHYVDAADHTCTIEERRCELGPALIRGAFQQLEREGIELDALVLLGDLVDQGCATGAETDLATLAETAHVCGLTVLALPGNHDGSEAQFAAQLGCCGPGLHELGGYGFLVFHDLVAPDHATTRGEKGLCLSGQIARQRPDLPLIALQHNPLHPPIDHEYPFVLTNADPILEGYREAGVLLSLSGHYHPGQPAHPLGGTIYYTVPAACEAPFSFAHVRLRGRAVEIYQRALDG